MVPTNIRMFYCFPIPTYLMIIPKDPEKSQIPSIFQTFQWKFTTPKIS